MFKRPAVQRCVLALMGLTLVAAVPAGATGPTWEHWKSVPGIFDVAGPRHDGTLVVAGNTQLFLVDAAGDVAPFARGPQGYTGYADVPGSEAYLTVSAGQALSAAGCSFAPDDVFVLRLHAPLGITRIDAQGNASSFATVAGVDSLNGIAFDTTGSFGYRLLVSGLSKGETAIAAIDCTGTVTFITHTAPALEGGLAVAPAGFTPYGGDLMAPDELSGKIYAIGPDGVVTEAALSGLPSGGDVGVESVAFVPQGFTGGGFAYYSDRATPGSPHPGTDSLLRLSAAYLAGAGVHDGDLIGATEGGATMVDVRCSVTCQAFTVVQTASTSHGEGHIAFTVDKVSSPASSPAASPARPASPNREPLLVIAALFSIVAAALASTLAARRRRGVRSRPS
jgi:hypothetical protein